MVILFVTFFFAITLAIIRPRLDFPRWIVFAIVFYFFAMEDSVIQFFTVNYPVLYLKFLVYLLIVSPLILLWILSGMRNGIRISAAVVLSFLALLLCTRPTLPFARAASLWKLSHFPLRYTENVARLAPDPQDVAVLQEACGLVAPIVKTRLIAHLRGFPLESNSNECLIVARNWKGPVASLRRLEILSDQEWYEAFKAGNNQSKAEVLDRLRDQKNGLLIDEAIESLNSESDRVIISAVHYLRGVTGQGIGNDQKRWKEWRKQQKSGMRVRLFSMRGTTPLAEAGFSALQAQSDLYDAGEMGQDFLRLYLANHFPRSIPDSQVAELHRSLAEMKGVPESQSYLYRKGMLYFFIALAETCRLAEGSNADPKMVESYWKAALENYQRSPFLGEGMSREISAILLNADRDQNKRLSKNELAWIVQSRK
jgi:hypothetical protein